MAKRKQPARTKTWTMVETVAKGVAGWRWRAHLRHWLGKRNPSTIREVFRRADMATVNELRIAKSMREMVVTQAHREHDAYHARRATFAELLDVIEMFETDRKLAKVIAARAPDTGAEEVIQQFFRDHTVEAARPAASLATKVALQKPEPIVPRTRFPRRRPTSAARSRGRER